MNGTVCLSFDFDAMSVWFGFERATPAMLNRGEYGARVGVPRILDLLARHEIRATFFVPGHTVESFPQQTNAILESGHEIAHHSYAHVDPSQQSATRSAPTWSGRSPRSSASASSRSGSTARGATFRTLGEVATSL